MLVLRITATLLNSCPDEVFASSSASVLRSRAALGIPSNSFQGSKVSLDRCDADAFPAACGPCTIRKFSNEFSQRAQTVIPRAPIVEKDIALGL